VTRGAIFRVKDEPVAEKADALAASLSKKLAASLGTGYEGYTRLVCKGAFDYKVYYEFSPDAFGRFKAGPGLTTFEETVKEFSKLSVDGKVHTQNFVIEGFGKKK
jgi:hypothetical protein